MIVEGMPVAAAPEKVLKGPIDAYKNIMPRCVKNGALYQPVPSRSANRPAKSA